MLNQSENNPVLTNSLLFLRTSMIAGGIIIVICQSGKYFNQTVLYNYPELFFLVSFLAVASVASIFVYFNAKANRWIQSTLTLLLTPGFAIAFTLAAVFLSEMFYGGSGYHGEYMFPFFK